MQDDGDERTPFPRWPTELPGFPTCTRLHHLEPLGVGTAWAESLTGYIARLADAHCVRVSTLVTREIGPLVAARGGVAALVHRNWTHDSRAINGVGATAQVLVDTLHTLTGRPDLRLLTMLTWSRVLPPAGLLRRERAWCPACYQDWHDGGQVVYEPLLWSVRAVTGCPRHGCGLCNRCPACRKEQPPLAVAARPGYCARCGAWLGVSRAHLDPAAPDGTPARAPWAQWAAEAVGDLIAAAPAVTTCPTKEHLARAIVRHTGDDTEKGRQAIAQAAHISHAHLWAWRRGLTTPTLPLLLRLCGSLGLPPVHLLAPALPPTVGQAALMRRVIPPAKRTPPPPTGDDHATIRRRVAALLHDATSPPPSLRQVAAAVGHTDGTLRRLCPDLCAAIVEQWRVHRRVRKREREHLLATSVRQAILQVHAAGLPLTTNRVGAFLSRRAYLRTAVARQAWRDTTRDLGLGP